MKLVSSAKSGVQNRADLNPLPLYAQKTRNKKKTLHEVQHKAQHQKVVTRPGLKFTANANQLLRGPPRCPLLWRFPHEFALCALKLRFTVGYFDLPHVFNLFGA